MNTNCWKSEFDKIETYERKINQNSRYYSISELIPISKERRDAIDKILSGRYVLVKTEKEAIIENQTRSTKQEREKKLWYDVIMVIPVTGGGEFGMEEW